MNNKTEYCMTCQHPLSEASTCNHPNCENKMNNKAEALMPCPFCGGEPNLYEQSMDIGAGDHQYLCRIICECDANPVVYMEGERGYKQPDDTPNDLAKANAIKAWNTRKGCAEVAREAIKANRNREDIETAINKAFGVSDE